MESWQDVLTIDPESVTKSFSKGITIQRKGQSHLKTFFVKKGLLRSYIIYSKGKEHIFMFAPEGWIIADVESLEFSQPTKLFIDCLENSEVIIFNRNRLINGDFDKNLINRNFKLLYRRMGMLQQRILMQMSAPASDRYHYFLETYPQLPNRVPQHMIASYLGITPQALSTLRSRLRNQ